MYISAQYIDIKLAQDYANFIINSSCKTLVLCDGIGQFKDSGIVSEMVVSFFIDNIHSSISDINKQPNFLAQNDKFEKGGTTIILASSTNDKEISIEYLGNGGVIQLAGDFASNSGSNLPYRYSELMLPHVSPTRSLIRHFSHNSGAMELIPTKLNLSLNHSNGDIVLFFTDGISSLEDKIILKDGGGRYWRNESASIQYILQRLNDFLTELNTPGKEESYIQDSLVEFNIQTLKELKDANMLEDDASLGIAITRNVFEYYNSKRDV